MKWKNEEIEQLNDLLHNHKNYVEISKILGRTKPSIKEKCKKLNLKFSDFRIIEKTKIKKCLHCGKDITGYKKFCNNSCSASFNNKSIIKVTKTCLNCDKKLKSKKRKFCSHACQLNYQYKSYIQEWKQNNKDGQKGIKIKSTSSYIRRYILEKFNYRCAECGWDGVNI